MKFLVFIALVVSLWYVMRWIQQTAINGRLRGRDRTARAEDRTRLRATDMVVCPRCRTYVPTEFPTSCGRSDCPFPGVG